MSETEGTKSVPDNDQDQKQEEEEKQEQETSIDEDTKKTESADDNTEKEEVKTPEESKPTESEDKSSENKKEVEKKSSEVKEVPLSKPTSTASDQTKSGECNLLPVLVERLRSALEQSCSSQSSEDPLPLEDSGIDSEEDLRMWASGLCNTIEQNNQSPKPLDLKFLEDLLLSDIQTALSRLQDTLKRVDINTLTKYNSTLDSTNKLHLLRLISNLLSKLKIPEELTAAAAAAATATSSGGDGAEDKQDGSNKSSEKVNQKRRRANSHRHTIGVSAEEIALARKLLDEKNLGNTPAIISPDIKIDLKPIQNIEEKNIFVPDNKPAESIFNKLPAAAGAAVQPVLQTQTPNSTGELKTFEQVRDKHVKDAINQQQTYYNKNKEFYKENVYYHPPLTDDINTGGNLNRVEIQFKDDSFLPAPAEDESVTSFYQQSVPSKYNKFGAKKSKIKRANTIDIPNYLKLQADNFGQNQAISLRRPIDIGDKNLAGNNTNIIPAFKPKTDNDRKFLALINKNNDAAPSNSNLPFKSFNYRQPANIDKNWNSRFSNIKTTFDKPLTNFLPNEEISRAQIESSRRSQSGANSDSGESDGVVVGSLRLPYIPPSPKQKQGGFTHAPTSPFQKIEKPSNRNENASIFKSGYLPKGGNSLQAKVKMFNQDNNNSVPTPASSNFVAQTKNKFNKISESSSQYAGNIVDNKPGKLNQHAGSFSYNHNSKQNFDSNKNDSKQENTLRSYLPGNRNVISSKLIVNPNVDDDVTSKVKPQYPYSGYQTNTIKNKTDKAPTNDEQNAYNQFQQNVNSYPEKIYSGYNSQQKNIDVPARTSSHSFMLQKIANETNNIYENKPKANRYVNEALKIKDNKETRSNHQPLTSHYIKPLLPSIENYSDSNVVSVKNNFIQNKNTLPAQKFTINNDLVSNKTSLQEYNNPPKTKINTEYKPLQAYSTHDDSIRLSNVPNPQANLQDMKMPFGNTSDNMTQNLPPSYDTGAIRYSENQTKDNLQFYNIPNQRNPMQDVKAPLIDPNYDSRNFAKSFDASNERYSAYPTNDGITQPRNVQVLNKDNFVEYAKPLSRLNSVTGKLQSEHNPNLAKNHLAINKQDSNSLPYQSYQTKIDSGSSSEHLKNYHEPNYYNSNTTGAGLQNDRLQNYSNLYDQAHDAQNQMVQYNLISDPIQGSLEENNSDKEIQMYAEEDSEPLASSTIDVYQSKDMLLEDENIQNQDISSDGIVTRYQCAIATVATTPESSEADVTEVSFPNPKLYNLKIAAYPASGENQQSQIAPKVDYGGYCNQTESLPVKIEPERESIKDESSDAFEEIQRHNLLQQQIIEKLRNEGNSSKDVRRRSLEKFKWDEKKSPIEIPDRRSSYYEKLKSDDRSPTSPLPSFPFNKTNTPPKQSEEPVIECNNTLEKINIFEEKIMQPLPTVTRQRFRPLSIPKFENKPKDFQPPKINVVTPSKIVKPKIKPDNDIGVISSSTNICDSSDEYLMSCASRQSRSIVLSKSESWHQLALSRGNLHPPQPAINHLLKPPKPKSPASLKLSKQYEASSSADNMKRMEEKIQRYFHSPTNVPSSEFHSYNSGGSISAGGGSNSSSNNNSNSKRDSKSKRHFSSKKNQNTTGLSRSHTMPHLYDEKLIIDENTDVEKAFDSLFMEVIKTDNRY